MAMRLPPNLHSLYMSGMWPLGVECLGCKRRALVPAERFGGKSRALSVQRRHAQPLEPSLGLAGAQENLSLPVARRSPSRPAAYGFP
jgi:hypothetical protein